MKALGDLVKLTVNLCRPEIENFSDLLRTDKQLIAANVRQQLSVPCEAWTAPAYAHPPSWADTVDPLVDVSQLRNSSSSLLLLLRIGDRVFAVTFGYAQSFLQDELLVSDFGLRVTANAADPDRLAVVGVRTVSENSRQQRSQTTHRSRIVEFDVEVEREWLRYLKGDVQGGSEIARSVGGSQSLTLSTKAGITDLPEILSWLLDRYHAVDYKEKHPYLDNYTPVPKRDPVLSRLNEMLATAIANPSDYHIGVASPDDLVGADVEYYKIFGDGVRNRDHIEELSTAQVLDVITRSPAESPLDKLRIYPCNADDARIRPTRKLVDYLVLEIELDGAMYVLCLGQWYKVASNYVEDVNEQIANVDDLTDDLALRTWPLTVKKYEADYNKDVAQERNWILMDKEYFYGLGGPHQKIEVCDLLNEKLDFICVKRMEDSATLSHLFSQASVSATLYDENVNGYADAVLERWRTKWPNGQISRQQRLVLAIATEKPGTLSKCMYFFSKVNLAQRLRDIRRSGFRPALAKINR